VSPIYSGDVVRSTFRRNHRQFFSTGLLGIAASAFRPPVPLPPSNITTDQDFEIPVDCSRRKPHTRFFDEKDRGEHPITSPKNHGWRWSNILYESRKKRASPISIDVVQSIEIEEISENGSIYVQSDGEHLGFLPRKFQICDLVVFCCVSPIYSGDAVRSTFRRNHRQFFSTGLLGIAASASRPPAPLPPSNTTTDQDFEIPVDCSGRKP
ncbi:hypothetical protein F2Q70_00023712, partial [Brassica cretica]